MANSSMRRHRPKRPLKKRHPWKSPPLPRGRFVVKVQVSLNDAPRETLTYNADRSVMHQEPASPDVLRILRGRDKAYFWAWINKDRLLVIDEEAGEQDW